MRFYSLIVFLVSLPDIYYLSQTFTVITMVVFACLANVGMLNILIAQVRLIFTNLRLYWHCLNQWNPVV